MALYRVHMTLARNEDFPNGSRDHGYEMVVPLDKEDMLDAEDWKVHSKECSVRRFWGDDEVQLGLLRHIGRGWTIDFDLSTPSGDEPFFKLDRHKITPGEYLSVKDQDGEMRTFHIETVKPV